MIERAREAIVTRFTRADAARLISSLILATMLWGYVSLITDPEETQTFSGLDLALPDDIDDDLIVTTQLPEITVRLTGPESVIEDITPNEIELSLDTDDIDGPIDDFQARVQIDTPDGVRRATAEPAFVRIAVVENATPKEFVLKPDIVDDQEGGQVQVGTPRPEVSMVTVSGPAPAVDRVTSVLLPIEIGDHTQQFVESFAPVALDANGAPVPEAILQPSLVRTTVPIILRGHSVAVLVRLSGQAAPGYQVGELRTIPLNIVVDGPDALLESIVYVNTEPVDISSATEDIQTTVPIDLSNLPEGVTVLNPTSGEVQVVVQISQVASRQTLPGQAVQIFGLDPGLGAVTEPAEVGVVVETSAQQIELLQPGDIVVSVDVSGLGSGTYQLNPSVSVPAEMSWIRTDPELVTVTITESDSFNGDGVPGIGGTGTASDSAVSPEASPVESPTP